MPHLGAVGRPAFRGLNPWLPETEQFIQLATQDLPDASEGTRYLEAFLKSMFRTIKRLQVLQRRELKIFRVIFSPRPKSSFSEPGFPNSAARPRASPLEIPKDCAIIQVPRIQG